MSSRCALRITEQGGAGPPAFTALLGRERVVAALGEHRCARSRAWGARGAPLRPHFGLICLEPSSVHPLLRKTCTRASRIAVFRLDFDARVHVFGLGDARVHVFGHRDYLGGATGSCRARTNRARAMATDEIRRQPAGGAIRRGPGYPCRSFLQCLVTKRRSSFCAR